MNKKYLEKKISRSLHPAPAGINEAHFTETLILAGKQARKKSGHRRISFPRFLSMQIKFIGWKIWAVQGIFLFIISGLLIRSSAGNYLEDPLYTARLLFCLSILAFMAALPFLYRPVRYQMQEIEAAARFSSVKLLMAKLMMIGIGNIAVLGGIFCVTIWKTSMRADSTAYYLCMPLLLAGGGCLFLLGHFAPKQFFAGSMGLCAFFILASLALSGRSEPLFHLSFPGGRFLVCMLLAAFCAGQIRYILYRSPYTEMQIA